MGKYVRNILLTLLVIWALWYLFTRPESAANFVTGVFDSLVRFFDELVS